MDLLQGLTHALAFEQLLIYLAYGGAREQTRMLPIRRLCVCGQVPAETVAGDVEEVRDRALRYSLENGVAFLHKTLSAPDQAAVRRLFASGAVQVRHPDAGCTHW